MYSPLHYQVKDEKLQHEVIEQNPFATLISSTPELNISHLPIYLIQNGNTSYLSGHMARHNQHWKVAQDQKVTVIFQGPHAYISPAWYVESLGNVPTWNYLVVHAHGKFSAISDEALAFERLKDQVARNEGANGWQLPNDLSEIHRLFKAIVVFEITELQLEGKFKLSQKHTEENKLRVIEKLKTGSDDSRAVADYMKRISLS